jgi:chromosome segregation ATPase
MSIEVAHNDAIVPMQNMLMVIAQSNAPLQQEMQKTFSAFQQFMEGLQRNMETLTQENARLCKQLVEADSRSKESETVYQAKTQALQDVINNLSTKLLETDKQLAKLENSQTAIQKELKTVNQPDIAALRTQVSTLEARATTAETSHKTEIKALADQVNAVQKQSKETATQEAAHSAQTTALTTKVSDLIKRYESHYHCHAVCRGINNQLTGKGVTTTGPIT